VVPQCGVVDMQMISHFVMICEFMSFLLYASSDACKLVTMASPDNSPYDLLKML